MRMKKTKIMYGYHKFSLMSSKFKNKITRVNMFYDGEHVGQ